MSTVLPHVWVCLSCSNSCKAVCSTYHPFLSFLTPTWRYEEVQVKGRVCGMTKRRLIPQKAGEIPNFCALARLGGLRATCYSEQQLPFGQSSCCWSADTLQLLHSCFSRFNKLNGARKWGKAAAESEFEKSFVFIEPSLEQVQTRRTRSLPPVQKKKNNKNKPILQIKADTLEPGKVTRPWSTWPSRVENSEGSVCGVGGRVRSVSWKQTGSMRPCCLQPVRETSSPTPWCFWAPVSGGTHCLLPSEPSRHF